MTRGIGSLLTGDVASSLSLHPLAWLVLPGTPFLLLGATGPRAWRIAVARRIAPLERRACSAGLLTAMLLVVWLLRLVLAASGWITLDLLLAARSGLFT